jgi:hypothetical protein
MTHRLAPIAAVCAGALLALGLASAHAAPITYTGTDATPANTVREGQAPALERARFVDTLDPLRTRLESFESFLVGSTAPLSLLFGATAPALAELTMPDPRVPLGSFGEISDPGLPGARPTGRFNTSPGGSQWWEASGSFSISFDAAIEAFAFYATDLGDFEATLTIEWFLGERSGGTRSLRGLPGDGTLDFWGLTDTGGFDRVSFTLTQPSGAAADEFDFIGFDDLIAGYLRAEPELPPPQGVPEPLTLALVGLGLAGIALTRRRRP